MCLFFVSLSRVDQVHIRHLHWFMDTRVAVAWFGHPDNDEENDVVVDVITLEPETSTFISHGKDFVCILLIRILLPAHTLGVCVFVLCVCCFTELGMCLSWCAGVFRPT